MYLLYLSYRNAALMGPAVIIKPTRGREDRIKEGDIKGGGIGEGEIGERRKRVEMQLHC
jgi:hypothetical protein